jgi:transcription-repair coupling factor (superfamily II helicase)
LLERAVQALREGREPDLEQPLHTGAEVDLQLPALLPEDYIPDVHLRLQLYKRMAAATAGAALDDLQTEMVDRFGPLPPPSVTLLQIHRLRLRAAGLGIRRLEIGAQAGRVEFGAAHHVDPARVVRLLQQGGGRYRMDGEHRLRLKLDMPDAKSRFKAADGLLDSLGG